MSRLPMLMCMWVSVPGIDAMRRAKHASARRERECARARVSGIGNLRRATLPCVSTRTVCVSVRMS